MGTILIVGLLAYALYYNRAQFQQASFSMDYALLALSSLLWLTSYLLFAAGWSLVLRGLGSPIGWWRASRIWFLSQGLKYIPGKVVYAFGRVHMAQGEGVRGLSAALGLALETLLSLASALLAFLILFPLGLWPGLSPFIVVVALAGLVALVLSLPLLLGRLSTRWPEIGEVSFNYRALPPLAGLYLLTWLVVGFACYFSFRSLGQAFSLGPLQVLGLYALSWAAGFVALFAPGGLGVRDGMLIFLMSRFIPLPQAALGAALVRVQTLVIEGLLAFLSLKVRPGSRS
jgi:uncharacterized membrane protein YbhN (UPF0104 family)